MMDIKLLKDVWIQLCVTVLVTLLCLSNGMMYGWTSPMIPYFTSNSSHIATTPEEAEWFETLLFIGSACGLPGTVLFVNYFGRRGSTIIASIANVVCWLMILFADRLWIIYVSRFFSGMSGNMCFISVPMYVAEIADCRIRGFLSTFSYLMLLSGILVIYCTGALMPYFVAPTIGMLLGSAEVIAFALLPESPFYYLYNGDEGKAKNALSRLRSDQSLVEQELKQIKQSIEREKLEKGRPKDLFMIKSNRKGVIITLLLNASQHFIGISVMLMNVHVILKDANSNYLSPSTSAIYFSVIMLCGAITASAIIDRFGRKFLLISSALLTGISLLITAIYFQLKNTGYPVGPYSWIPVACVMSYAATFKTGMGIVPIVIVGEIFPTTVKAMGMTLADFFYVVFGLGSLEAFSVLYKAIGMQAPFFLFATCSFTASILIYFYVPETKGKTLEEIQLMLKGHETEAKSKETISLTGFTTGKYRENGSFAS